MTELQFDDSERMLDLGTDTGLYLFELVEHRSHRVAQVQRFALARPHGDMAVGLDVLSFLALGHVVPENNQQIVELLAIGPSLVREDVRVAP